MDVALITEQEVKRTLECMRRAEPMAGSALLKLPVLRARLREAGETVSPQGIEWALGHLLTDLIWANLAECRGQHAKCDPVGLSVLADPTGS